MELVVYDFGFFFLYYEEVKFILLMLFFGYVIYGDGEKFLKVIFYEGYQIGNVFVFVGRLCLESQNGKESRR